ncbi:MAG: hypothetical protein ACK4SY_03700 [Pyrobaculum sp.]
MHNPTKTLLLLTILALTAVAYAQSQGPGVGVPVGIDILMQINDARGAPTGYELCTPWPKGLNHTRPYSFAAGKNFTLIIREIATDRKYPDAFRDLRISAVANGTGFVRFSYTTTGIDPTKATKWYVAIVVEWPAKGYYFLVYNETFDQISLLDLQYRLSGNPEGSGVEFRTGPWGVLTLKHGSGNFGNLSSSVIHTFYVGVDTLGKQYDLTFTRTVTIAGKTFTLDDAVAPRKGPTDYVKGIDPRVTAVFGPFTYLGTYITSFGDPGKANIQVDNTKVKLNHYIHVTIEGYRAVIIQSENKIFTTDTVAPNLRHFAITLNMTTTKRAMSCGLIIWNITAYTFKVTGLYDLKGNPIFNPEAFRFKLQARVGDRWLTLDRVQGAWRTDIPSVVSVIMEVCGFDSANDITPANLLQCYRNLGKEGFANAVFSLYEPVVLTRLASVKLVDDGTPEVSPQGFPTKLVVEYVYYEGSNVVNALVLEAPLAAAVNYEGRLTVSILPIQIKLWRWGNATLPLGERQYFYTDPLDLASLKFVAQGDTMYVAKVGTEAVSLDPWTGQAVWVLPPYQLVPGLVGNVKATLLVGFNASGYLPMPTLVANLTDDGKIKYFNETDVAENSNFFAKYNIALRSSYEYGFRIYKDDALVGTANLIAYYPIVNQSGFIFHIYANKTLEAKYGEKERKDMYNLVVVTPGRFYDREHVLHIAIIRVLQNILIKDACGNPLTGIRAGAFLTLTINMNGRNLTIARLPLGSEVPVDVAIPIDEWGNPLMDIKGGYITATGVVSYFGYELYAVDDPKKIPASAPAPIRIPIRPVGAVAKPEIYIPVAAVTFFVEGFAVSVDYDPSIGGLMGFVVSVSSVKTKEEIARGISNKDGLVYIPGVPVGKNVSITIRTIDPGKDRRYSYTFEQRERDNSYDKYAKALGRTPADNVYTLGTRGAIDSGLVVNTTILAVGVDQICGKKNVPLGVVVYDLVVRVYDKTGKYLLRSQPVYFGPYPQATRAVLLNVTLLLADTTYPDATLWRDYNVRDYYVLTDFRAMGITAMKSIYRSLAERYLSEAKKAAKCGAVGTPDYAAAINAYALASMAGFVAETSTDHFNAEFLLRSRQPKSFGLNLCEMTVDQLATAETARLFLKGQRLRFVVWYMGQKVYDDYVTITGPEVRIFTDVYPVNITAYTKSLRLPVDAFVGFTLTDVYLGLALNKTNSIFANKTLVPQLLMPFDAMYKNYGLEHLLKDALAKTTALYNVNVTTPTGPVYYGSYVPINFGGDFAYLPNIMVWRNATQAVYQYTVVTNITTTVTEPIESCTDMPTSGRFSVPALGNITITLNGTYIEVLSFSNKTYAVIIAHGNKTMWASMKVNGTVLVNDTIVGTIKPVYANKSITLTIKTAVDGSIAMQSDDPTKLIIKVYAGSEKARINYIATNMSCIEISKVVTVSPGREYAVTFDRWLLAPGGQLYHAFGMVNREDVLGVLTHAGARRCATQVGVVEHEEDDEYVYRLTLKGVEVANFRTLFVRLPWRIAGDGKALVNITAAFRNNGTRIDSVVYNLTEILAGVRANEVNVTLSLNFGKVAAKAYDIARTGAEVEYTIRFYMYRPTAGPMSVCAITLVPLGANYTKVSMYECERPVAPGLPERIDPEDVIYALDPALSNQYGFNKTFDTYAGFGTPITYVVKSGDVALLPAWYGKTSVAGSRIARVWIIAANKEPSKGPALGTEYEVRNVSDYKGKVTLPVYKFYKYLVVNYVPNICKDGWVSRTFLDEFDGSGRITGVGFGTSGTSTLVISNYTRAKMWNSTAMWLAGGRFKLPTVALDALTVKNDADFPIYVTSLFVQFRDWKYEVPMDAVRVDAKTTVERSPLKGYGFGRTYMFNITDVWAFRLVQPNYKYGLKVYHGGVVDALRHFGLPVGDILKKLTPLTAEAFVQNVLYASHAEETRWTYRILYGKIEEITRGMWNDLRVDANDTDYKYVFSMPTLPLVEVRDWNDRPLANQTVALFDRQGNVYAVVHTTNDGRLRYPLPKIDNAVVRVSWFNGYLRELLGHGPQYTIWIYDSAISRDVTELGDATSVPKIRTYVYPLTVTVSDPAGRPLAGLRVKVYDSSTGGQLVSAMGTTGTDGSMQVVDLRVSKYPTGVISQVPPTSYTYEVYYKLDDVWVIGANGTYEIQRGASVPAAGFNLEVKLSTVTEIPVTNAGTKGYILFKNVKTLDGVKDITVPFTIRNNVMKLEKEVPSFAYDVEVYVTHVTVGGVEFPVAGGKRLVWSGKFDDLAARGLDFAELGVTARVKLYAKDGAGAVRPDWTITVKLGDATVATGKGEIDVVLPRTDVIGKDYTVTVVTTARRADGTVVTVTRSLAVVKSSVEESIPVETIKVTVRVVDGFGVVRADWPVEVDKVESGSGQITVELVKGEKYVARATGLGRTEKVEFTADVTTVDVRIPTAKIIAQVVDGFGAVRDWPVEVSGPTPGSGRGSVEMEVLAGSYTVKTAAFGKEFTASADVKVGEVKSITVKVPTAKLSVRAVDDERKPLDIYVTAVEISGPVRLQFAKPPEAVEVLEGSYTVTVSALGKQASASITLASGAVQTLEVVVPGTAGLDFFGTRIPLPTLVLYGLLLLVIIIILAILIIEYNNWRRRRLMQILAPPK